jgi:uncharacterized BrkB/YihY/UPF0761 family membrane protein
MKGQITIIVFAAALLDILVLAVLAPLFDTVTGLLVTALGTDTVSIMLARLIVPVLMFGIIFSALYYISPNRNVRW